MSYKFKIGPAILSGSNTFTEQVTVKSTFSATELSSSGQLEVGGTVRLDGVADIGSGVAANEDSFYFLDATDSLVKSVTLSNYASAIAGDGVDHSNGVLSVAVDDSGIEVFSDTLRLKNSGVIGDKIASGSVEEGHFKLGAVSNRALASGSVETGHLADDAVTLAKLDAIARGSLIVGGNANAPTALDAKTSGQILVGDGTDLASVAVSGDVTITSAGVVSIGDEKVVNDMLKTGSVGTANLATSAVNGEKIASGSITTGHIADEQVTLAKLAHAAANTVLVRDAGDAGDPSFKEVTDTQILIGDGSGFTAAALSGDVTMTNAGVVSIGDQKVVNDMLKTGSVGTANLASSAVNGEKIASGSVTTGHIVDEQVTLAKLAHAAANTVLVRDANSTGDPSFKTVADTQILIGDGDGFTAAALSGDVTMANDGAVTIANSAVETAMIADANVTTGKLATSAVVGDKIASGSVEHGHLANDIISGQGALSSFQDADIMLIGDDDDSGVVKKATLGNLAKFFQGMAVTTHGNANSTLVEGLNYSTASIASSNKTYTLPASAGLSEGDQVIVKAGEIADGIRLVISGAGDQTIDQQTGSIDLLDDGAAVTLVYVGSDKWFIV